MPTLNILRNDIIYFWNSYNSTYTIISNEQINSFNYNLSTKPE